jgi:hypothetical protein
MLSAMDGPQPLTELIELAHKLTQEGFAERVGAWVFVGAPTNVSHDEWSYRTLSSRTVQDTSKDGELIVLRDSNVVHRLKKKKPGPFADTVLIGRSSSNDVVIEHASVSKLHARAKLDADGSPSLSDAGSSNGTRVSGDELGAGEPRPLKVGDVVTFGSCSYHTLDTERLYSMLQRFKPKTPLKR